ncbi:branched-chain-amino-acid transaminase bat2 [Balamuthia mandrillaris]
MRRRSVAAAGTAFSALRGATSSAVSPPLPPSSALPLFFGFLGGRARLFSTAATTTTFQAKDLKVQRTNTPKAKPKNEDLTFGANFTDHMLTVKWSKAKGWEAPLVAPYRKLELDPSCVVFHYGLECFDGLKAYRDSQGKVRLFRPEENMKRLHRSCQRLMLPGFDEKEALECLKELIKVDRDWVPDGKGYSLYIRPTVIGTQPTLGIAPASEALFFIILSPVGPYYKTGWKPIRLLADDKYVRAWPGGTGSAKIGGNYASTVLAQSEAEKKGFQQILWLFGDDHQITEVGTMNLFVLWINQNGERELITAPVSENGLILPGVTRDSVLQLMRQKGADRLRVTERPFTMKEPVEASEAGRVIEVFGTGTAAVVSPVKSVSYKGKEHEFPLGSSGKAGDMTLEIWETLQAIQHGERPPQEWSVLVD